MELKIVPGGLAQKKHRSDYGGGRDRDQHHREVR
jgi:hypothetical protein